MTAGKFFGYAGFVNGLAALIGGVYMKENTAIVVGIFLIVVSFFAVQEKD
jgi:hypothetical protein